MGSIRALASGLLECEKEGVDDDLHQSVVPPDPWVLQVRGG